MTHQVILNLTDQEYGELTTEAARSGKQPETLLREFIVQGLQQSAQVKRPMTGWELAEKQYREGKLANLAKPQPLTSEELAERERLAQVFAGGKPASEMLIEDRGPY